MTNTEFLWMLCRHGSTLIRTLHSMITRYWSYARCRAVCTGSSNCWWRRLRAPQPMN